MGSLSKNEGGGRAGEKEFGLGKSIDLGHWGYSGEIPADFFGFIYIIENTLNNKKYIGKKQCFKTIKRKPLKGRKRRRHEKVESDWKTYCGSCDQLLKDIEDLGKSNFTFNIIKFCNSKSDLAYSEAKLQFENDVLLREDYYNGIINVRVGRISGFNP